MRFCVFKNNYCTFKLFDLELTQLHQLKEFFSLPSSLLQQQQQIKIDATSLEQRDRDGPGATKRGYWDHCCEQPCLERVSRR